MSAVASVTFTFDGTQKEFEKLYDAITQIDIDIGAYSKGTTGVIEFMIDDFRTFKEQVAKKSAELGVPLVALDYLLSEKEP
jgi:lysophospholipase L1-like esterase